MSPAEMLEVLDYSIAAGRGRKALVLTSPTVALAGHVERGKMLRDGSGFGYTRRQCKRMKATIVQAIRDDLQAAEPPPDWDDPE